MPPEQRRRELAVNPCRTLCRWRRTPAPGDEPLFACQGCGSQWVPSEAWTPVDADGSMPQAVRAQRRC